MLFVIQLFSIYSEWVAGHGPCGWVSLLGKLMQGFGVSMVQTEMLKAIDGVTKYNGSDVGGTWLQLLCCTLPKCLCPQFTSGSRMEIGQRLLELGQRCCTRDNEV